MQARSQDFVKGGRFWKVKKTVSEIETEFSAKISKSKVFSAQKQKTSKKKEKVFT